jgi:hypothetical protein
MGDLGGEMWMIESRNVASGIPAEVTTHLESLEDRADVHHPTHNTGKPD